MIYTTRRRRKKSRKKTGKLVYRISLMILFLGILGSKSFNFAPEQDKSAEVVVPTYCGQPYVEINNNIPFFEKDEIHTESFERYAELDLLGRCGVAYANVSEETMPDEERGQIGMIKPTGWHTVKYPKIIESRYLYNRCHLIAWCLSGENDNEKNLITGTRYMNTEGMLPFENMIANYIDETGNHVLYRVTPIF